jgi:hypothetical protein
MNMLAIPSRSTFSSYLTVFEFTKVLILKRASKNFFGILGDKYFMRKNLYVGKDYTA